MTWTLWLNWWHQTAKMKNGTRCWKQAPLNVQTFWSKRNLKSMLSSRKTHLISRKENAMWVWWLWTGAYRRKYLTYVEHSCYSKIKKKIYNKLFSQECPAKKWTDTPECKKGKEWFKKCRSKKEIWMLFEDNAVKSGKPLWNVIDVNRQSLNEEVSAE